MTAEKKYDYDTLPDEVQKRIAQVIADDTLENSNRFYPEVVIRKTFYMKVGKRAIDVVISGLALLISVPVNLIIGIVTFFDVGLPLLFVQERMGKDGKIFKMVKFRSMRNTTDENGVLLRADLRTTKWGKFVRSSSLDELMNFLNIFKGDMSLIGPRPLPIVYKGRFNQYHEMRHSVKPGLDCPLRDPSQYMTWANRLENDVWYARNISFFTDIKLIFLLFKETFAGKDRKVRSDGFGEGSFMGYYKDGTVMDSNHIPEIYYRQALGENNR